MLAMTRDVIPRESLRELVRGTVFSEQIHHFEEIDSTNSAAMLAAQSGATEGSVFVAERQTEGRGRGGNIWHSEGEAIYLSVVLRPKGPANDVLILSLATGLAVAGAVEEICGIAPDLRWPNDIMLREKKLGGILCELNADSGKVKHAVIGIGLNVNQAEFPEGIREVATSLLIETGKSWPRVELIGAVLRRLDAEYQRMQS